MKKVLSLLLAATLIIAAFPIGLLTASAEQEDGYTYEVTDGKATITYVNKYFDYDDLVIPDTLGGYPVTKIGDGVFASKSITSVYIPENVTDIGERAFQGCYSLNDIYISKNIANIGENAFSGCGWSIRVWYTGSEDDRSAISDQNSGLANKTWYYNICSEHSYATEISLNCDTCEYVRDVAEIIVGFEVEDVMLQEGVDAQYHYNINQTTGEHENVWYEYQYTPNWKIILADGSEIKSPNGYSFYYEGQYLSAAKHTDGQSYEKQWVVGGEYSTKYSLNRGGFTDYCNITITESPFESIKILSHTPIKETNFSSVNSNGNRIYNTPDFKYEITLKGGTTVIGEYPGTSCEGVWPDTYSSQSYIPWTVGGENKVIVSFANLVTEFYADLQEADDWEYIEQNGGLFITTCHSTDKDLVVPDTIDGKPVIGIMSFGKSAKYAETITIPDSVTYISNEVIDYAWNEIQTINIGSGVANLDADAFSKCEYLKAINISGENPNYSSVDGIVYNKSGDTLIVYPLGQGDSYTVTENVTNIDVLYTKSYYSHINVVADENSKVFKTVDGVTYNNDMSLVISCDDEKTGEYVMPESVNAIANAAFAESNLSSVTISKNVTAITYFAFANCSNLETVNMPDSITVIETSAFSNCSSLETIDLPDSITEIGGAAFSGSNLKNLKKLPKNLKSIGDGAFRGTQIVSLNIPTGLEIIGESVFASSALESINLPDSVTDISYYTFKNCVNLKNVKLSKNLKVIRWGLFDGCKSLKQIEISSGVETIDDAFNSCNELEKIVIPESVTYIYTNSAYGSNAFSDCDKLTIYCYEGSYAQNFAVENEIPFEIIVKSPYKSGDINDDQNINNKDLGLLMQYLNNWDVTINKDAADVNRDGNVNNKDYGLLMQYLNNWNVELK